MEQDASIHGIETHNKVGMINITHIVWSVDVIFAVQLFVCGHFSSTRTRLRFSGGAAEVN
jgi:hypothetical protein